MMLPGALRGGLHGTGIRLTKRRMVRIVIFSVVGMWFFDIADH